MCIFLSYLFQVYYISPPVELGLDMWLVLASRMWMDVSYVTLKHKL